MSDKNRTTAVETWQVRKPAVTGRNGLVASQHYAASRVGAKVLADGGNAIDAAVATSLMIGTVEPWMSGLGGGGFLLYYDAAKDRTHSIEFGMRAPMGVNPGDYPLIDGQDSDLFGWPSVLEDRNVLGPHSIAIPGYLAGINAALSKFGSRSFADLITPAIDSAHAGMSVDWYATLKIASAAGLLANYPTSAQTYLPDGFAPAGEWGGPLPHIVLGKLASTLESLRDRGPQDFYNGEIASLLYKDLNTIGSSIQPDDLINYQPLVQEAEQQRYREATIYSAPGMSAGPTLRDTLSRLESHWQPGSQPDADTYSAYANALQSAYEHRLTTMGDIDDSSSPACTTHISIVDKDGNMVALTQTLLSVFGSKVMLPSTGVLMNNGMMWFDPRSGRPNSIAAGKRPLSNMCPTLFQTADGQRYALGASGGRRIMPAVMQLISFIIDFNLDIDQAVHQPRIDVSGTPELLADEKLDAEVTQQLSHDFTVKRVPNGVYPALFGCPSIVCSDNGQQSGGAFVISPWAEVSTA